MKEATLYSLAIMLAGTFSFIMAVRFILDKDFGERYVRESPKAFIWRKLFGEEKAYRMTRTIFAPLGMVVSACMIVMALIILSK